MSKYKLAAISDIHGNAEAFQAVLQDIDRQGVDGIVVCGDMVVYCPQPEEVIEILKARRDIRGIIIGNTDRYLIEQREFSSTQVWQQDLLRLFDWTMDRIGQSGMNWLRSLAKTYRFEDILFVHGSPRDDEEGIYQDRIDSHITQVILEARARAVVCGHTHLRPFVKNIVGNNCVDQTLVANLCSVGLPFDGDARASYAIIENHGVGPEITFRRVDYAIRNVIGLLKGLDVPGAKTTEYNLLYARPKQFEPIYNGMVSPTL